MDLMVNGSLDAFDNNNKTILEPTVWVWLSQALKGLSLLAERRLVHDDIKPANLFLDAQFNLKIGDFGFLREFDPNTPAYDLQFGTPE